MGRSTVLLVGILSMAAFAILCVRHNVAAIQDDLSARSAEALADPRFAWADVEVSGRDLTLTGFAPAPATRRRAVDALEALYGVRRVRDATGQASAADRAPAAPVPDGAGAVVPDAVPAAMQPYWLSVSRNASGLVLEGLVPDDASRSTLTALARARFGDAVSDRLSVAGDAPQDWNDVAAASLVLAGALVEGEVAIRRNSVFVTGLASSDAGLGKIDAALETGLPPGYTGQSAARPVGDLSELVRTHPGLARRLAAQRAADAAGAVAGSTREGASAVVAGQETAAAGCQRRFDELLDGASIGFETGSSVIDTPSLTLLARLGAEARRCPTARIEIAGHTDDQGTESDNLALSQRRAEAVRAFLVSRGIDETRLLARGYGESRPLVPNLTADHRARNRRIEFRVVGTPP